MKIVVIGANGTMGQHLTRMFANEGHEIVKVGRTAGDIEMDIANPACIEKNLKRIGQVDAITVAAGEVAFAPLKDLARAQWTLSLEQKLLGQIQLVQNALPFLNDGGSITLVSGVLGREFIRGGVAAATVNGALEAFVRAASLELPRGIRLNVVSPTLLEDSLKTYGPYFPGFAPVSGVAVARAFAKSVYGIQTGTVFDV